MGSASVAASSCQCWLAACGARIGGLSFLGGCPYPMSASAAGHYHRLAPGAHCTGSRRHPEASLAAAGWRCQQHGRRWSVAEFGGRHGASSPRCLLLMHSANPTQLPFLCSTQPLLTDLASPALCTAGRPAEQAAGAACVCAGQCAQRAAAAAPGWGGGRDLGAQWIPGGLCQRALRGAATAGDLLRRCVALHACSSCWPLSAACFCWLWPEQAAGVLVAVPAYSTMQACLICSVAVAGETEPWTLYVTGHSLGGALALLAAFDLQRLHPQATATVYTFGAPRVRHGWLAADPSPLQHLSVCSAAVALHNACLAVCTLCSRPAH